MDSSLKNLQDNEFEKKVLKSDEPCLIDFWAPWCGPCKAVTPILEELGGEYNGKLNFYKINIDENGNVASKFGVKGIPTIMFFKNGELYDQIVGVTSRNVIEDVIKKIV